MHASMRTTLQSITWFLWLPPVLLLWPSVPCRLWPGFHRYSGKVPFVALHCFRLAFCPGAALRALTGNCFCAKDAQPECRELMVNPWAATHWKQWMNASSFHSPRPQLGVLEEGLVELSTSPTLSAFPPSLFQSPCPPFLPPGSRLSNQLWSRALLLQEPRPR